MTRYSDRIFVKAYKILSFAINIGKNIGKNYIFKNYLNFSDKNSQKLPDHAKQSATDAHKTSSKRAIKKQQKQ